MVVLSVRVAEVVWQCAEDAVSPPAIAWTRMEVGEVEPGNGALHGAGSWRCGVQKGSESVPGSAGDHCAERWLDSAQVLANTARSDEAHAWLRMASPPLPMPLPHDKIAQLRLELEEHDRRYYVEARPTEEYL